MSKFKSTSKKSKQSEYIPVVGLEIHIQLKTQSKMFCRCSTDVWQTEPNTHVCPTCLGLPGSLPVINYEAVVKTIKTGLTLDCQVAGHSFFERKNYFYPDLPKGYQISQFRAPLCVNGLIDIDGKKIGIERVHLEEDTGKSIHETDPSTGEEYSLLDFNKCGIPLMEIVSAPDISSAKEAVEYCKTIQQLVRFMSVAEANPEKGQIRFEVNISLREGKRQNAKGKSALPNYRVEVKNLNSFRFVHKVIEYEIIRQKDLLEKGETPIQETRGFDEKKLKTISQRGKEGAHDYRYFPEPDLPPLRFSDQQVKKIREKLSCTPWGWREILQKDYGLKNSQAKLLTVEKERLDYFLQLVQEKVENNTAANLIINRPEILRQSPGKLATTLRKQKAETIKDQMELELTVREVIEENPQPVEDFHRGKTSALQYLIGQVMKETSGKAHPQIVKEILERLLSSQS